MSGHAADPACARLLPERLHLGSAHDIQGTTGMHWQAASKQLVACSPHFAAGQLKKPSCRIRLTEVASATAAAIFISEADLGASALACAAEAIIDRRNACCY